MKKPIANQPKREAREKLVRPIGLATMYLSERDGPYRMEIRECRGGGRLWAYFYKGKKRVWDCNDGFAREHFVPVAAPRHLTAC